MKNKVLPKCVSVVSGGGDSITCGLMMLKRGYHVIFLHVDHGQKCEVGERLACQDIVKWLQEHDYKCSLKIIEEKWLGELGGSGLTDKDIAVPEGREGTFGSTIGKIFTPNRNSVLLGIAGAIAEVNRAEYITFGYNKSEVCLTNSKNNKILLLSSSFKLPSEVREGDKLKGYNESTKTIEPTEVRKVFTLDSPAKRITLHTKRRLSWGTIVNVYPYLTSEFQSIVDISRKANVDFGSLSDKLRRLSKIGLIELREGNKSKYNPTKVRKLKDFNSLEMFSTQTKIIEATLEHPFYTVGRGWVKVKSLNLGDVIFEYRDSINRSNKHEWKEKSRKKLSVSVSGKGNPMYGHIRSDTVLCWCGKLHKTASEKLTGRKLTPERIDNMKISSRGIAANRIKKLGHHWNLEPETRKKLSKSITKAILEGRINPATNLPKPTSMEKKFSEIIVHNSIPLKYVGDGQIWITTNGKHCNPDYINIERRKVVELWGDWWHTEVEMIERANKYRNVGWECLLIHHKELKDENSLIEKTNSFLTGSVANGWIVKKIEDIPEVQMVYNFHCEPHNNFFVNGLLTHNSYPDNTKAFLDQYTEVLKYSTYHIHPKVLSPEWEMQKPDIYKWAWDNGFKEIISELCWSCDDKPHYLKANPMRRYDVIPCGHCGCDRNRRLVFYILGEMYGYEKYYDREEYSDKYWFINIFLPLIIKNGIPKNKWFSEYANILGCKVI